MANSHVAHNCHVFNNVILCNGSLLGGHVHVHDAMHVGIISCERATPLRVLGNHPEDGAPVNLFSGRYGPYVSHDGVNATLTGDLTPETVTLDQALALLSAKSGNKGGKKLKGKAKARSGDKAEANAIAAAKSAAKGKDRRAKTAAPKKRAARPPSKAAIVVIMMGRKRRRLAS